MAPCQFARQCRANWESQVKLPESPDITEAEPSHWSKDFLRPTFQEAFASEKNQPRIVAPPNACPAPFAGGCV